MRVFIRRAAIACLLLLGARATSASPGSFVYVATKCTGQAGCTPSVLVYDASTSALVTSIQVAPTGSTANPTALAISPDGTRVYVDVLINQTSQLIGIDATRHQSFNFGSSVFANKLAVSRDGSLLFVGGMPPAGLFIYDTGTHGLLKSIPGNLRGVLGLAADPVQDRVYWTDGGDCSTTSEFHAYDTVLGNIIPTSINAFFLWTDVFVSHDDSRLYLTSFGPPCRTGTGDVLQIDPVSLTVVKNLGTPSLGGDVILGTPMGTVDAPGRHRMYVWDEFGTLAVFDRDTFAKVSQLSNPTPSSAFGSMAVTADESRAYLTSYGALSVLNLATNMIDRRISLPSLSGNVITTPPGAAANVCSYRVDTTQSSWTVNGGSTSFGLKTACAWFASSDSTWARVTMPSGTGDATLSLTVDPNFTTANRTATLSIGGQIVTVTQASFSSTAPFGTIDTPADYATGLSGAISVTGWALDDVGVKDVRIYRDPVAGEPLGQQIFIGNATLVDGARPDVQAAYPSYPYASRAGWGLQLLTNMLPNQGSGTYRLYAFADDVEGHTTLLGFRAFTSNNAAATLPPFGTIDTPGQGDTVSGTIVNFGWALSSNVIATDGSTIDVFVDGAAVGHPVYNNFRSDIASLFPGLPNSNGAIGYYVLDTTRLTNGVHTIAWVVRDSSGATQGIGSRFFTVLN